MNLSVHIDSKAKNILILGDGPIQGLGDTTLTAEAIYSLNFTQSNSAFCLSLHYNGSNSFLFVNATKNTSIQSKRFWNYKKYPLCLRNVSADFSTNSMIKTRLDGSVRHFSVDYSIIDTSNNISIHKYLKLIN